MFICPNCQDRLGRAENAQGIYWVCRSCRGRAVSLAVLRKAAGDAFVKHLWLEARTGHGNRGRPCPTCDHDMLEVAGTPPSLRLDLCRLCQFVWFDPGEFERAPVLPESVKVLDRPEMPIKAREALALYHIQRDAGQFEADGPASRWQYVPAFLGFPVEQGEENLQHRPVATWSLSAAILLVSLLAMLDLRGSVMALGLIPAQAFRMGGLTFITSFFLHGGVFHLLGNLYFLMIFGDNVEDYLGRKRFLWLVALAAGCGDLLHVIGSPGSTVPCIGASGGISAIIVFYALQFPQTKLGFFVRWGVVSLRWIRVRARMALGIWLLLQVMGALFQLSGYSHVSSLAHLGGAAFGFAAWYRMHKGNAP